MSSVFSSRLVSLRKERKMTQTDLANALHKTRSTISGYETEGKEPDYDMLCSIAKYFGVTIDYLLGVAEARRARSSSSMTQTISSVTTTRCLRLQNKPLQNSTTVFISCFPAICKITTLVGSKCI